MTSNIVAGWSQRTSPELGFSAVVQVLPERHSDASDEFNTVSPNACENKYVLDHQNGTVKIPKICPTLKLVEECCHSEEITIALVVATVASVFT
jgi:hypothetical protein